MSQSFEINGTVKHLLDLQTFPSGFSKREFVIEVEDGKYPQMIKFECVKDRVSILDGVAIDDQVQVTFDIRGNEFKERFYVNLNAWKLSKTEAGSQGSAQAASQTATPAQGGGSTGSSLDSQFDNEPDDSDEIPF